MSKVIVYSDAVRNTPELVTAARSIDGEAIAVVVGTTGQAASIAECGVEKVLHIELAAGVPAEAYSTDIARICEEEGAHVLLVSTTPRGRAVAAMVAQMLHAPCASEVRGISLQGDGMTIERSIYGGKAISTESVTAPFVVATVPLRSYEAAAAGAIAPVEERDSEAATYPVRVVGTVPKQGDEVDVTAADTLVVVGRGFAAEEDCRLAEDLAAALGGVVACSRPVAEDLHWYAHERYVGMSGKQVKPKLMIAVGVAGQIQCMAGCSGSKVIVGINKDEAAPVTEYSDYFVVADLYEVLPAITAAVKAL